MKTYQKPIMIALSLTGNEQLCGTCAKEGGYLLMNDKTLAEWLLTGMGLGLGDNGIADRSDFNQVFGTGESGCTTALNGYCKFTNNDDGSRLVAWS